MNWSKGPTVKEKILLHLLNYTHYFEQDNVPEEITQLGIANSIIAPRPHVSMALKDLRTKQQIIERICHIKHGKRKQKGYNLTPTGQQIANRTKQLLMESEIKVKDRSGERIERFGQICSTSNISIFKLLNQINADGVFDLTHSNDLVKSPGTVTKTQIKKYATPPFDLSPTDQVTLQLQVQAQPHPQAQPQTQLPTQTTDNRSTLFKNHIEYLNHLSKNYPDYYSQYYQQLSEDQRIIGLSLKTNISLFFIGYLLIIIGAILGLYIISSGESFIIIPFILILTFGIATIMLAASSLWSNNIWQKRILDFVSITFPIIIYIMIYALIASEFSYYDISIWLIIIFSFLALANYASFIPIFNRAKALSALGIILLINVPIALFLNMIDIYQMGFWSLISVLCIYTSYNLLIRVDNKNDHVNDLNKIYPGIVAGLGLGILVVCVNFLANYDLQNPDMIKFGIYGIIFLWCIISIVLITRGIVKNGALAQKTIQLIILALPFFLGIVLFYFCIFLISINKPIEAMIEVFLGFIVIIYGLKQLKDQELSQLLLIGTIAFALISTLGYILIY